MKTFSLFFLVAIALAQPPATSPGTPVNSVQFNSPLGTFAGSAGLTYLTTFVGPAVQTVGTGLNDVTSAGSYTDGVVNPNTVFTIQISATGTPDSYKWKKNSGAFSGNVAMTGVAQTLSDGVTITWAATTGHTLNDTWTVTTKQNLQLGVTEPNLISCCDGQSNSVGVVQSADMITNTVIAGIPTNAFLLRDIVLSGGTVSSPTNINLASNPSLETKTIYIFTAGAFASILTDSNFVVNGGDTKKQWNIKNASGSSSATFGISSLLGGNVYFGNSAGSAALAPLSTTVVEVNRGTPGLLVQFDLLRVRTPPIAVGSLPTCNAAMEGAHAAVNDSNAASYAAGIGTVVANGGTTHVPVYCDGTNWRIG